jgi:uncharacterized protein with ParB-like and HNH nuclease domain
MRELVFNTENIFNTISDHGVLMQYECLGYHIPAYQRGYKWGSDSNGAVTVLLSDLNEAFQAYQNGLRTEYYLQYITVKKIDEFKQLEVIDGQQRLTTLSIIFSVFSSILEIENIADEKISYAIRDNFFQSHIYPSEPLQKMVKYNWEEFIETHPLLNKQDIYYLFSAVQKVNSFLTKEVKKDIKSFYDFICSHVMIIVNSVESHVSSETVFRNLNSNQVPLTEAELIKGYLITRIGRKGKNGSKLHFKEILELRANLGRKWDEMSAWCNRPEINAFYFSHKEGMEGLLKLSALLCEGPNRKLKEGRKEEFHLFNFYHTLDNLEEVFELIKEVFNKLFDWYNQNAIYNLIGFCRFTKGSKNNHPNFLINILRIEEKDNLLVHLDSRRADLLPEGDITELRYGGDEDGFIHAVLLHLSVFSEGINSRFNFYRFEKEKWTLEHIFPQSPEGKKYILTSTQKHLVKQMLGENLTDELDLILDKDSRSEDEKNQYYDALKRIGPLNSMGNMCLLSSSDNSSNGNKFFTEKRQNVLSLIQKGSFVPKHTFNVFSKMISGLDSEDMNMWTMNDIEKHLEFISNTISVHSKEESS